MEGVQALFLKIISGVISFIILSVGLEKYFSWKNTRLKEKDKLSLREAKKLEKIRFSLGDRVRYQTMSIASILFCFLVSFGIIFSFLIPGQIVHWKLALLIVFSLFLFAFLSNLSINLLSYNFPKYNYFLLKIRRGRWGSEERSDREKILNDMKNTAKALFILLVIGILGVVLISVL